MKNCCPNCKAELQLISESEGIEILQNFKIKLASEKINCLKELRKNLLEHHWICNAAYDIILSEFCSEIEFAHEVIALLINNENLNLCGSKTQFNPFVLLLRYEYIFSIINLHSEYHSLGVKLAKTYLPLAVNLKGLDDEITQKIAYLIQKWAS